MRAAGLAILSDTELPDWLDMLPGRNQADKNLAAASSPVWLMPQLYFDLIQNLCATVRTHAPQIMSHTL